MQLNQIKVQTMFASSFKECLKNQKSPKLCSMILYALFMSCCIAFYIDFVINVIKNELFETNLSLMFLFFKLFQSDDVELPCFIMGTVFWFSVLLLLIAGINLNSMNNSLFCYIKIYKRMNNQVLHLSKAPYTDLSVHPIWTV